MKWFSIPLLVIVLLATFNQVVVYTAFKLNQTYLTTTFCTNKYSTPEKLCSGTCKLEDLLTEETEENKQQLPRRANQNELVNWLFFQPIKPTQKNRFLLSKRLAHWPIHLPNFNLIFSIFHPPQVGV